ncbi:hypothetical protein [Deinococcus gobiensis]|uniref:hypothetical protein n=1 Tax=Deinococcus gobiensis TaxID=502394 RepID=UPI00031D7CD7|nr:hypothetical protein [Deinococcus gobiensis]
MSAPQSGTHKGTRGFELDIHLSFSRPLPEAEARAALLAFDGFRVDLYRPHPAPTRPRSEPLPEMPEGDIEVPSARLTGPLRDPEAVRAALAALLGGPARYAEVGLRGLLRSAEGVPDWMPWRRNVVLARGDTARVAFEEGVKYVLE